MFVSRGGPRTFSCLAEIESRRKQDPSDVVPSRVVSHPRASARRHKKSTNRKATMKEGSFRSGFVVFGSFERRGRTKEERFVRTKRSPGRSFGCALVARLPFSLSICTCVVRKKPRRDPDVDVAHSKDPKEEGKEEAHARSKRIALVRSGYATRTQGRGSKASILTMHPFSKWIPLSAQLSSCGSTNRRRRW